MRGSVYKYRGKRGDTWCIRYEIPTGQGQPRKQKHESLPGLNKKEAQAYLEETLRRMRKGTYSEPSRMTLNELLDDWLDRSETRLSPTTWQSYEKYIRIHLKPALGATVLFALRPMEIQRYYDRLAKSKALSPKSIRNLHGILRTALGQAVRFNLIERNPAEHLDLPRKAETERKVGSEEDIARLVDAFYNSKYLLPLLIAMGTGMRRGEVLGLKWSDYDADAGQLTIRHSLVLAGGKRILKETKTGKVGTVGLPPSLAEILKVRRRCQESWKRKPDYKDEGWICADPDTGDSLSPAGLTDAFRSATKRLGIDLVFHGLRHTHVTFLLGEGIPVKDVSERARHSSAKMTFDVYGHATPHGQAAAVNATEGFLSRVINRAMDARQAMVLDGPEDDPEDDGVEIVRIFPDQTLI